MDKLSMEQRECIERMLRYFGEGLVDNGWPALCIPTRRRRKDRWSEEDDFALESNGCWSPLDMWWSLFESLLDLGIAENVFDNRHQHGDTPQGEPISWFEPDRGISIFFEEKFWDEILEIAREIKSE